MPQTLTTTKRMLDVLQVANFSKQIWDNHATRKAPFWGCTSIPGYVPVHTHKTASILAGHGTLYNLCENHTKNFKSETQRLSAYNL
jgi:hypothetical protein